jgi:hypothetical protein
MKDSYETKNQQSSIYLSPNTHYAMGRPRGGNERGPWIRRTIPQTVEKVDDKGVSALKTYIYKRKKHKEPMPGKINPEAIIPIYSFLESGETALMAP